MKKKDFGLLLSLSVLFFLAIFSEKKVLIAEGFAISSADLDRGATLYQRFCQSCHSTGKNGAPRIDDAGEWQERLNKGMRRLIGHAVLGFQGKSGVMPAKGGASSLTVEEVAMATAYMVAASTSGELSVKSGER